MAYKQRMRELAPAHLEAILHYWGESPFYRAVFIVLSAALFCSKWEKLLV